MRDVIARVEWAIKCALERPSNYDRRVSVLADDLRELIERANPKPTDSEGN